MPPLKMLVMPIDSIEYTKDTYVPFVSYLEKRINRKVDLITPPTYADVKTLLLSNTNYDIINLNGVLFSQYFDPKRYQIFSQETSGGDLSYNSVFIANRSSNISQVTDIKGHTLALNNKYSTSGGLVPTIMLANEKMYPNIDYTYKFYDNHLIAAKSVANGYTKVGAVSWRSLKKFIRDKKIQPDTLRIIGVSFPIPLDPWLLNKNLPDKLKSDISSSFYQLSNRSVLNSLGSDGFVPATESTYNSLRLKTSLSYQTVLSD